jgi:hypothetical protein
MSTRAANYIVVVNMSTRAANYIVVVNMSTRAANYISIHTAHEIAEERKSFKII